MEGKKKITLKDIAAKTGLSVNTVSRVLNKKPYYTKEVEEKVTAACKELGYIVDMNASGLRSVMARKPDGILSFLEPTEDMVGFIKDTGIPFVIFGRDGEPYGMCGVNADEEYGGYVAGKHLLDCGYRKLAYIGSWHDVKVCLDRQKGFERAIAEKDVASLERVFYIRERDFGEMVEELVASGADGIFCFNDIIAFIVIEALEARGMEAGTDYGIVGYDNIQEMLRMPRLITTVDVGSRDLAEAGASAMLALLAGEELPAESFRDTHKCFLVKGKTTR